MLDDEDRITEIAQVPQGFEQAFVIALMEADAGFIQDIKNANQASADLRGQTDALGFSAAEGAAFAIQRQIIQADIA
jgi:hypothetical protein